MQVRGHISLTQMHACMVRKSSLGLMGKMHDIDVKWSKWHISIIS